MGRKISTKYKRIRTYVEEVHIITLPQVVQHCGLVEVSQFTHIFDTVKLGRVHAQVVLLILGQCFFL